MARAGFAWAGANRAAVTCRARPDGEPRPPFTRIDGLFLCGLGAAVPAVGRGGLAISGHDLIAVDGLLGGPQLP